MTWAADGEKRLDRGHHLAWTMPELKAHADWAARAWIDAYHWSLLTNALLLCSVPVTIYPGCNALQQIRWKVEAWKPVKPTIRNLPL